MRIMIKAAAIAALLMLLAPAAQAANAFFTAEVTETGLNKTGGSSIRLTDTANAPAFKNKWFLLPNQARKEMLAMALTAISGDLSVRVRVDLDEPGMPLVKIMYLQNE